MISATIKGADKLAKALKAESRRSEKALNVALRVEGFQLSRALKKEIRQGAPGGRQFRPLTFLARRWGGGRQLRPNKPLQRLALAVRYFVAKQKPYEVHVGWTGPRVSKSWKRLAQLHQKGFTAAMTTSRRRYFARKGGAMSPRAAGRRFLFLKKSTRQFRTPARPILDPFWDRHQEAAWMNIRRNFKRKLAGQRI